MIDRRRILRGLGAAPTIMLINTVYAIEEGRLTAIEEEQLTAIEDRRLTLVVGFASGGSSSISARIIADSVGQIIGIMPVVENRPGAGGALAADSVRSQPADNLLFLSSTSTLNVPPESNLVPIGIVARFTYVAVVRKDAPASLAEYMNAAEADSKLLTIATAGAGSIAHLAGMKMFHDYGMTPVNVPFRGSAPAILAVVGGHIPLAIVPFPDFLPFVDSLRVVAETGNGLKSDGWMAVYASPKITPEQAARLSNLFHQASKKSKDKLEAIGFRQVWLNSAQLQAIHRFDYEQWAPMAKR
jgi:tripartite-type tricarboxylate transporter receptor subunit TctC